MTGRKQNDIIDNRDRTPPRPYEEIGLDALKRLAERRKRKQDESGLLKPDRQTAKTKSR